MLYLPYAGKIFLCLEFFRTPSTLTHFGLVSFYSFPAYIRGILCYHVFSFRAVLYRVDNIFKQGVWSWLIFFKQTLWYTKKKTSWKKGINFSRWTRKKRLKISRNFGEQDWVGWHIKIHRPPHVKNIVFSPIFFLSCNIWCPYMA